MEILTHVNSDNEIRAKFKYFISVLPDIKLNVVPKIIKNKKDDINKISSFCVMKKYLENYQNINVLFYIQKSGNNINKT